MARAPALHAGSQGFDSLTLHILNKIISCVMIDNKRITILSFLLGLFVSLHTFSQSPQERIFAPSANQPTQIDFSRIDNYVLGLRTQRNTTEAQLSALITRESQTKMEKARAIFIWIANNIAYDTNLRVRTKEEALRQGRGVCEAYSALFQSLAELAGLEVVTVTGDAKQYYYRDPSDLDSDGHAWNVVKVEDDRWVIVDATWGAGHVENRRFTKKLTLHWFDPAPELYIFTHLPQEDQSQWQLLNRPVTREEFLRMPPLSPELALWGFNPAETFAYFISSENASFPEQFTVDIAWKINTMPVSSELKTGEAYKFEFVSPNSEAVSIVSNGSEWTHFNKDGDIFSATFTPATQGDAILTIRLPNGRFGGVFRYDIVN